MDSMGNKIKKLRKECEWTQEDLATRIQATKQVISNWERNIAKPELKHLIALAEVFRIKTDYLLGLEERTAYMHAQGGEKSKRGKHWDWVFQKSYDLIEVIQSDYRFKINDRFLTPHDKEIIVDNINRLYELLDPLKQEYEDRIKELEDQLNQLKGITNGPMDGQESLF
jgi:DNA-binding XRE family transcriptional regulator